MRLVRVSLLVVSIITALAFAALVDAMTSEETSNGTPRVGSTSTTLDRS